jgi:hypothetical protein
MCYSSLIIHQGAHTGERPYDSNECGRLLKQSSSFILQRGKATCLWGM